MIHRTLTAASLTVPVFSFLHLLSEMGLTLAQAVLKPTHDGSPEVFLLFELDVVMQPRLIWNSLYSPAGFKFIVIPLPQALER